MLNYLRMDIYRILRSKSYYVCLAIIAFTTILSFGLMYLMTHADMLTWLGEMGMPIAELSSDPDFQKVYGEIDILSLFHSTNISGSFLPVINGILGSLFICVEFEGGFIKNIISTNENKWNYILAKIFTLSFINVSYLVLTYLMDLLLNVITGSSFTNVPAVNILFYLFSAWMLCNGFSALILLVCMIFRNKAAGSTAAVILCSGMVIMIIGSILGLFRANGFMKYTLYANIDACPMSYNQPSDLMAIIVGIVFTIIYTVASGIILSKKDIA